jgi:hypothetical protein
VVLPNRATLSPDWKAIHAAVHSIANLGNGLIGNAGAGRFHPSFLEYGPHSSEAEESYQAVSVI